METRNLIIMGSSRSFGHTYEVCQVLLNHMKADLVDLNSLNIQPFDYAFNNQDDDFLPLMRRISTDYDTLIFATPIYWYSMSGTMKCFFDRITDCLTVEKDLGRTLRGKHMAAIACGSESEPTPYLFKPFESSAEYLGMHYLGDIHTWKDDQAALEDTVHTRIQAFAQKISKHNF